MDIYCTLHGSSTYIISFVHMHELILKSECQAFTILFCEKRKIKFFWVNADQNNSCFIFWREKRTGHGDNSI